MRWPRWWWRSSRPATGWWDCANHASHARFVARELTSYLLDTYPLVRTPGGRTLMGSSFGGVAAVSIAAHYPGLFGSLFLESASLVFTDIGANPGGGPAFDPVVKFVNAYRARPRRIVGADLHDLRNV